MSNTTLDVNTMKPVNAGPKTELEMLREEVAFMKTCGIIELAIRNPNVMSYMDHWEKRADEAEKMAAMLSLAMQEAIRRMKEACAS